TRTMRSAPRGIAIVTVVNCVKTAEIPAQNRRRKVTLELRIGFDSISPRFGLCIGHDAPHLTATWFRRDVPGSDNFVWVRSTTQTFCRSEQRGNFTYQD